MRTFIFFCASTVFLNLIPTVLVAETVPRGVLVVPENAYSFGTVNEGAKVSHEFILKNSGNAEIQIQRIAPSCGCTVATSSSSKIEAGGTGKIAVEFDTSGFNGEKTKTVQVFTNDFDQPQITLTLKGTILSGADIDPVRLDFGEITPGSDDSRWTKDFTVNIRPDSNLKISEARSFSKFISVVPKDNKGTYTVTLDRAITRGPIRDRVIVILDGAKPITLNVPIIAFVRGDLRVSPSTVSFGVIEGTNQIERSVKLENSGTAPVKILSIESDSKAIEPILKEIQPGKAFVIQVKLDPSKIERDLRAVVRIETNNEKENQLSFNVFGVLPPKR